MTSEELQDRRIEEVGFGDDGMGYLKESASEYMTWHCEYLGDHSECWVIVWDKQTGRELRRISCRRPLDIIWSLK